MEEKLLICIQQFLNQNDFEKCNALDLSKQLKLSRNIVSSELNRLYELGKVIKITSRPILFLNKQYLEKKYQKFISSTEYKSLESLKIFLNGEIEQKDFDKLIGYYDSLNSLVEKIKATVSYPPVGLPILFYGPTGTGKSFMAKLTYEFLINQEMIEKDKQFVQVNCSEYANNPELLTANLFGYKKGAFTGADKDNLGLLYHANGGVLFLDEVHCLKAECQEKLFLYMDQGIYHMVGDNDKWYKSSCRIIFATTENPEEVLLKTLLRRIPVILTIPSLKQRGMNEKLQLIYSLYHKEEQRIHKKIEISSNVYQLLLNYHFQGNIGELTNIIQSSCVNALFNQNNDILQIHAYHLPETMMKTINPESLLMQKHQMVSLKSLVPSSSQNKVINFYESIISLEYNDKFLIKASRLIDDYFEKIVFNKKDIMQSNYFLETVNKVLDMITSRYGFKISHNEVFALTCYLLEYNNNTCKIALWIKDNENRVKGLTDYLQTHYHREYLISQEAYDYFKDNLNGAFDIMVINILTIIINKYINHDMNNQTIAIILAHGFSTASSIAESVNKLLDTYIYDAIDMPLNVDSRMIVHKINEYLSYLGKINKLYLLVDMGSLEEIYCGIRTKNTDIALINNVNTKLALQIGQGIRQSLSMTQIFEHINDQEPYHIHLELHHQKEPIILCSCASGIGSANKLKTIIVDSLPEGFEVKVMTYDYPSLIENHNTDDFFNDYEIICVVGTLNPDIEDIPFIAIEDLIIHDGYEKLRQYFKSYLTEEQLDIFEKNILKNFSLSNVMNNLTILNPNKLLEHVSHAIDELQLVLNKRFRNATCFGLYVHICCLIERLITKQAITSFNSDDFVNEHQDFILTLKQVMKEVEYFYNVEIPYEEVEYIYEYVKND
ncbi:sigma 54-interacting transcriptional regulator [Thomasclavelia cocleata]|jgi:sigma-54 dependent transcriptional regulator of gfr operon|uniref:sigma 54-interacting transcriptional regulator n=1 Tax=Thomasclavelia cocleata TaxID=69824 RepID=UPI00242D88B2|nr:sigma 54-interacting transcriptional regulator [Thomasclavelia cocleata]MCI9629854.1 sigma 54-interacting transcriptional regulator [Thomasclavelia cocleata]